MIQYILTIILSMILEDNYIGEIKLDIAELVIFAILFIFISLICFNMNKIKEFNLFSIFRPPIYKLNKCFIK